MSFDRLTLDQLYDLESVTRETLARAERAGPHLREKAKELRAYHRTIIDEITRRNLARKRTRSR